MDESLAALEPGGVAVCVDTNKSGGPLWPIATGSFYKREDLRLRPSSLKATKVHLIVAD